MSLSESRALTNVHPALAERIRIMGDYLAALGGVQIYLSGFRTREEQARLFFRAGIRPVAAPGCSQHQYGYAVDVAWGLLREQSPIGHLSPTQINAGMSEIGRRLGLTTVERDPGHFQIFPGAAFKNWAVASGFCNPNAREDLLRFEARLDARDDDSLFGPIAYFGSNFFRRGFVF